MSEPVVDPTITHFVHVPFVVGRRYWKARSMIREKALNVGTVTEVKRKWWQSPYFRKSIVASQEPGGSSTIAEAAFGEAMFVEPGFAVNLTLWVKKIGEW